MKVKILYVEDEPFLGKIVRESLMVAGYDVTLVKDGGSVMQTFQTWMPDICVLDVMLPHIDGFTLAKEIRTLYPQLPVIFLTAKSQTEDLVKGFDSGGTDYIRKPFSVEELIVRIKNQLHLNKVSTGMGSMAEEISFGNFTFYPGRYELHSPTSVFKLSHRESQVLNLFATHQNQVIDRKKLLMAVWGDDSFFNSRTLDVYIKKLRDYFSSERGIEIITLKGRGYHFLVS
jgi:DNA-binding response OmpR family regulator